MAVCWRKFHEVWRVECITRTRSNFGEDTTWLLGLECHVKNWQVFFSGLISEGFSVPESFGAHFVIVAVVVCSHFCRVFFSVFGVSMCVCRQSLMQEVTVFPILPQACIYQEFSSVSFIFPWKRLTLLPQNITSQEKIWHLQVHAVTDSAVNCFFFIHTWPSTSLHCKAIFRHLTQCL